MGINIENPQGVLHIDGASTLETSNPASGNISKAQAADDVVIDASGRMGIGVAAPAARVHISSDTKGEALRIADGTQGDEKVLVSDADGIASWGATPGAWWYAALFMSSYTGYRKNATHGNVTAFTNYANSTISSTIGGGNANATDGTITVPFTGKYRISLTVQPNSDRTGSNNFKATVILTVTHGATVSNRWSPSAWGAHANDGTGTSSSAILDLEAGDVLRALLDHTLSYSANDAQSRVFMVEFMQ